MSQISGYGREVEFIDYIEMVLKRKWMIAAVTVICVALVSLRPSGPPQYRAEALVVVSQAQLASTGDLQTEVGIVVPGLTARTYEVLAQADELVRDLRDSLISVGSSPPEVRSAGLSAQIIAATEQGGSPLLAFRAVSVSESLAVQMANLWADLFLQRHRGLSSNVAEGYYQWVLNQNSMARKNLALAERSLRDLDASYSHLAVLEGEVSVRSTNLRRALRGHQATEMSLDAKRDELVFLSRKMVQVEWNGKWIGFVDSAHLDSVVQQGAEMKQRSRLVQLRRILDQSFSDSLEFSQRSGVQSLQLRLVAEQRLRDFEHSHGPEHLRARKDQIDRKLNLFGPRLAKLEIMLWEMDLEGRILQENLAEEPRTQPFSKAIVDEELWTQLAERGRLTESLQAELGAFRLVSDSVNPTYEKLRLRAREAGVEADLKRATIDYLRSEIPRLKEERAGIRKQLAALADQESKLIHSIALDSADLHARLARQTLPISHRLDRARRAMDSLRGEYMRTKEAQRLLQNEVAHLESQAEHEKQIIAKLQHELKGQTEEVDSLTFQRDRLVSERDIFKRTLERFSRLLEESRIARQQASGDIQIVSRAVVAPGVSHGVGKTIYVAGIIGLMASTMLAFLLEYVSRARQQKQEPNPTPAG